MGGQELLVLFGLWYLLASIFVGQMADENGRSTWGWFLVSLLLSPMFAVLCLIALPKARA
jgi:hypothetical protein